MPPLDFAIVQSAILYVILPAFGVAFIISALAASITRSDSLLSWATSIGFVAAFAVGNQLNGLVPFCEFETGWRSLFWVTAIACLTERLMEVSFQHRTATLSMKVIPLGFVAVSALWLTPWSATVSRPWAVLCLGIVIFLNWSSLGLLARQKFSYRIPEVVTTAWVGSAAVLAILSHSGLFADLAIVVSCSLVGVSLSCAMLHRKPRQILAGPAVFVPGVMLAAATNTYSNIPPVSFALIAVSPIVLSILRSKPLVVWFESRQKLLILVTLIPAVIAIFLAIRAEL